ncbi:MAG TPA: peptidoglycan DD-metalloendopeptidase family protein [Burkholderiales bacterium]|nr:peptidoglycan DD-metalloendopeptidase family protein [Burkholderiales bacterium]
MAISDANRALVALESQARAARTALEGIAAERAALEKSLESERAALGRLLAARALSGGVSGGAGAPDVIRVALSGESLADAARRLYYLGYVSRASAQMIGEHRASLEALARLRLASEDKARELAALESRARADRETLLKERRERRRLFERIAGEVRAARKRIQVLLADESRLARLVEEIGKVLTARPGAGYLRVERAAQSGQDDSGPFSRLKGRLRLPVRGELVSRFGAPRGVGDSGATSSKGVFIRATEGETVRAVAPGRVVYADWMRGFGNLLIVDHGENFLTIYGNNESLLKQTGDVVTLGDALATVGTSGGNEETGLYFELRHEGKPFDPLGWVKLK